MKRVLTSALSVILIFTVLLTSGCSKSKSVVYFYTWQEYIDPEVLELFKNETGIEVILEAFDTNEAMYVKVANGGGYDVIVPSDYMAERMIKEGLLEKLNMDNIPEFANIDGNFTGLYYDPYNEYFVSYMWGTLGIMYDSSKIETVDSWEILWDEQYADQIYMYDSVRDTMTAPLKLLGYSVNTRDVNELNEAVKLLVDQKPLLQTYLGEPVKDKMIAGEGLLALVYSGDAQFCQGYNENLDFAIPKEGSNIFIDGLAIPKTAKNKENAEKFINFLCRPDIAAMNSNYIGYATVNKAAYDLVDEELRNNHIYWASDEEIARCEYFHDLGEFRSEYERAWIEVLAAK